jgi:putative ABC transport system permease protein
MYQNFVRDNSNLLNVTGFEVPDVGIGFNMSSRYTQLEVDDVENRISSIDGIKEIKQYTSDDMTCTSTSGSEALNCDAYDDTNLYVDNIISGRNAQSDDEVMLSTVMADRLNVSEGDVVYFEMNGNKQDYIICGIFQGINHLGKKAIMSLAGIRRLDSTINPYMIYVYKTASASLDDLISNLKSAVKDDNVTVNNYNNYIASSMASVTSVMTIFSYIIILAVGIVIALVLMLLVKTQLVKDNRQYGIYKALGYTSGQLLLQTTMNYLPVVVLGTFLGCLFSVFFMNPLFVACLSIFGIKKCNMKLGINYMMIMVVAIILWSQVIIIANSLKIRKIVPCKMIREN